MSTPLSLTAASLTPRRNGVKQERISGGAFLPRQRAAPDRHTADDEARPRRISSAPLGSRIVNRALAPSTLKK